jgi:CRP-like cAMP-binding protein
MTADDFKTFLSDNPRVGLLLLQMLSRRLRDADRKRIEFGAFDTIGRVARRLVELADDYGEATDEGVRISLPLTQQDLAGWTGSSREAVSKALQTLRSRGWIATHRKGITVLDLEAVRRRAG